MSGKGDKRRPAEVPDEQLAENWRRIFGDRKKDANPLPVWPKKDGREL